MEKFTELTGIAAPLLVANVNTDVIIRVEHLGFTPRAELGLFAFEPLRYKPDRSENPDFVLNQGVYRQASILLADENFGCGSSREAAVWALWEIGIRCVIAPSFGDIFFNNCFQNGMLPITLPIEEIRKIAEELGPNSANARVTVDLLTCEITSASGRKIRFAVDPKRRENLLQGVDEIGVTLAHKEKIAAFQASDRQRRPWIYDVDDSSGGQS